MRVITVVLIECANEEGKEFATVLLAQGMCKHFAYERLSQSVCSLTRLWLGEQAYFSDMLQGGGRAVVPLYVYEGEWLEKVETLTDTPAAP